MNIVVGVALVFAVLLVLVFVVRKIKGLLIAVVSAILILVGGVAYVLTNPTSEISQWVTANIANTICLDSENKFTDGETIWSTEINKDTLGKGALADIEIGDLTTIESGLTEFLTNNAVKAAVAQLGDSEFSSQAYSLQFKDGYLAVSYGISGLEVSLVKGAADVG